MKGRRTFALMGLIIMSEELKRFRFRDSWMFRIGLLLLILGCSPLLVVGLAAELGITKDPNPNPVGFGIMFMFSFWPGLI